MHEILLPQETEWVENKKTKKKYKNKKSFCFYCETDVTNFSRHLFRNHQSEKEVQEILTLPKKDNRRKIYLQNVRKMGNFTICRPVRNTVDIDKAQLLPCVFCKGYYIKESLCFHVQKCPMNKKGRKCRPQAEGQSLMAGHYKDDDILVTSIFPTMRFSDNESG